jgi:hypothetical protein
MKKINKNCIIKSSKKIYCGYCRGKGKILLTKEIVRVGKLRLGRDVLKRCPECKGKKFIITSDKGLYFDHEERPTTIH